MNTMINIVIAISLCLLVGFISSQLQTEALNDWYPFLNKPLLTPPDIIFPIAWSILYIAMGVSIGLITLDKNNQLLLIVLFSLQLLVNFLWSIGFFYLQNPLWGFIAIIVLNILIILYIVLAWPVNKCSAILFIPYLLWVLFATYLNGYILINN